ncbi:flavin-containing monooxygenase [Marinobacter shengliensis]|uniref:flavin-containing monooxygenase n=1 Tax=Marinobacter shengliensis TaxID=1389223 RepID=UPI001E549B85|nr:NAD(P)-binding domain-containing protein [Marinobacter shengliensis]MCD1629285.1 NAD(P)/FAD-dependent oxidoreductase [Marinobacter shengliensis]
MYDVIVVGAGQAGLAAGYALDRTGLDYLIVEAGQSASGSWPHYYNSLKLFSPARFSSLPGLPFPGDPARYPSRDEVVSYLQGYARHFDLPIRFNTSVTRVERQGNGFKLHTSTGDCLATRALIVASGPYSQPNIPDFPGLEHYHGKLLHSSAYHSPSDIEGERVAVIGAGNSAVQIAHELSATHKVTLISRNPPRFLSQRPLGVDIHTWMTYSGIDTLPVGRWLNRQPATPVLDNGEYRAALTSGRLAQRSLFDAVTNHGLRWQDDIVPFDTLLLATGFHSAPRFLEGLDGLDRATASRHKGGVATHISGLYFVGQPWQRSHASATLRGVGADAAFVVKNILSSLEQPIRGAKQAKGCCA